MNNRAPEFSSKSPEDTENFAKKIGRNIKKGDILCLYGELGAGKTTFTRSLVNELGYRDRVVSPTFTIIRTYSKKQDAQFKINHVDLYRLESENLVKNIGLEELFDEESVTLIEWPERMGKTLPKKRYDIFIKVVGENERIISINKYE